jgi:hypothetical protein
VDKQHSTRLFYGWIIVFAGLWVSLVMFGVVNSFCAVRLARELPGAGVIGAGDGPTAHSLHPLDCSRAWYDNGGRKKGTGSVQPVPTKPAHDRRASVWPPLATSFPWTSATITHAASRAKEVPMSAPR